jgi:uncharacterized membrane protein
MENREPNPGIQISIPKKIATVLGFIAGTSGLLLLVVFILLEFDIKFHANIHFEFVLLLEPVALIFGLMSLDKNNSNERSRFLGALGAFIGMCFIGLMLYAYSFSGI